MEPECSLPYSQVPATRPYPEPAPVHAPTSHFLKIHLTSSLLGPNILLSTLFSNTLSLRSSLNVSNEFAHLYTTTKYEIIALYIFLYLFLFSTLQDKRFCQMTASLPGLQSALNFFLKRIFYFLRLFPNIWTLPPFRRSYYQSSYCDFVFIHISRHDHVLSFIRIFF